MSSDMTPTSSISPLLRLPLELRVMIWEEVLQDYVATNEASSLNFPHDRYSTSMYIRTLRPIGLYYYLGGKEQKAAALLYVSREINHEARKVLLQRFRFALFPTFNAVTPYQLAQSIRARDLCNIRNLEFVCPLKPEMIQWRITCGFMFEAFPNLRNVMVTVVAYNWGSRDDFLRTIHAIAAPFKGVENLRARHRLSLYLDEHESEWSIAELEDDLARTIASYARWRDQQT